MSDITKKFLDILFEPEAEEIEAEAPLKDVKENNKDIKNISKQQTKSPNVKDVLYGKQNKPSSFIDYFEVPKTEKKVVEETSETYEMREKISPIFGPITQKEKKKKQVPEKDIQKAVTVSTNEYTGIVISPIFGYDVAKANDARKTLNDKSSTIEEENIVTDPSEDLFSDKEPAFEIPEDMKETIHEAIQEAVVELNAVPYKKETPVYKKENVIKSSKEESKYNEDIKTIAIENSQTDDYQIEDPIDNTIYIDPISDEIFEAYEEPISNDSNISSDGNIETVEDNANEEIENVENIESFNSNIEEENESNIEDAVESIQKATRSIYDTTPIQLFDFNDIEDKNDSDKDLFDELIGDDD